MPSKPVAISSKKRSGVKASGMSPGANVSRGVLRKAPKPSPNIERWLAENPVRKWRESKDPHVSRVDLARMVGLSYVSIGNWEKGVSFPFGKSLEMLKEAIGDDGIGAKLYAWMKRGKV